MKRTIRTTAAMFVAAAMLAACSGDVEDGDLDTVRVALIPTITKAPMYVGMEQGFFEEEGILLEPTVVQNGAAVTASVTSGEAAFGSAALAPTVVSVAQGVDSKIVATAASTSPPEAATDPYSDAVIIVPQDSDIETLADLNGKTVAVNALQGGIELVVRGAVDRSGGDSSTIQFLVVPFPEMTTTLDQGQVDAIAPMEPHLGTAIEAGHRVLHHTFPYDPAVETEFVNSVYFTSSEFADANPDLVERFVRAINRSNAFAEENPDVVRSVVPGFTGIDEAIVDGIVLPDFPSELNKAAITVEMELMRSYGFIDDIPGDEALYAAGAR